MRLLSLLLVLSLRAWAIDDCVAGEKKVNLDNGSSTADFTGVVLCFDRDTKKETRSIAYLRGKQTGWEKRKWPSGDAWEQEYRDGKRHGESRKYEGGKLVSVSHYVDDRELGAELRYSKTGKVIRKVDRREPDASSTWQDFDEEGRLAEAGCGLQLSRKAGLAGCPWPGPSTLVFFFPDGRKHEVAELRDGLRQGLTARFNPDGSKDTEVRYARGLKDGLDVDFRDGKPRRSTTWAAGEKAGDEVEFFADGSKSKVTTLKGREVLKFTEYFQNGAKKFEQENVGNRSTESTFDDEGRLVERARFEDRKEAGLRERFFPDGGPALLENWVKGKRQGRQQSFYENGRPDEDAQWESGRVSTRKRWDPDGGLVEDEAFYEDGSRKKKP